MGGIEGAKCDSEGAKIQKKKMPEMADFGHFFLLLMGGGAMRNPGKPEIHIQSLSVITVEAMPSPSKPETHIRSLVVNVIIVEAMPNPSKPEHMFSGKCYHCGGNA